MRILKLAADSSEAAGLATRPKPDAANGLITGWIAIPSSARQEDHVPASSPFFLHLTAEGGEVERGGQDNELSVVVDQSTFPGKSPPS